MADEEDTLSRLTREYFEKFNDYPPWHVNHALDPEGDLQTAIETGKRIPEVPDDNVVQDVQ